MSKNVNFNYFQNGNIYCFLKTALNFKLTFKEVGDLLGCDKNLIADQYFDFDRKEKSIVINQ